MTLLRAISILLLIFFSTFNPLRADEVVLVVHKQNPVSSLKLEEIRKIFLGKKSFWGNGESIDVFLQGKSEIHASFVSKNLRKSPRQFDMYWKHILFSGAGIPPREVASNNEMLKAIGSNTNAIGYISNDFINEQIKSVVIMREE